MRNLPSLVSITEAEFDKFNAEMFLNSLSLLDPDLFTIKRTLVDWKVNAKILPTVIEQLGRLSDGGWGEVKIMLRNHKVFRIEGNDSRVLDESLTQDDLSANL